MTLSIVFAVLLHPAPGWTMSCHCACITITLSIQKHEKNIVGSYHWLLFYKYGNKLVFGIWHSPTPTAWWTWQHLCDLPGPSGGVLWEPTPHGKRREEIHVWRSCGAVSQLLITHLLCLQLSDFCLRASFCLYNLVMAVDSPPCCDQASFTTSWQVFLSLCPQLVSPPLMLLWKALKTNILGFIGNHGLLHSPVLQEPHLFHLQHLALYLHVSKHHTEF